MEDTPKLLKIPKSECPDIWIRLPRHEWSISWSIMEGSRSSWTLSVRSPSDRTIMVKTIRKSSIGIWCLSVNGKKTILVCACGGHKTGWKETEHRSNVESTDETSRFGRTDIIPWPRVLGVHSTRMRNKHMYCRQTTKYVGIQDLPRSNRKNYPVPGDLMQTSQHGPMIWKIMQRNAWSGIASWRTKQPSNCTKLQLHA